MRVGSLCTGIMGAELAMSMMGLNPELVWYSEIDPHACKLLAAKTDAPNLGNLKQIVWERVEPVDVLCAGYPCQPFSTAGNRKGTDDPRHLWPWIACALRVLRPRLALFENVAAHLHLGFDEVLSDLAAFGFDAEWTTLRASDVGSCHQRDRLFIVARDAQRPRTDALAAPGGSRDAVGESDCGPAPDSDQGRRELGSHGGWFGEVRNHAH